MIPTRWVTLGRRTPTQETVARSKNSMFCRGGEMANAADLKSAIAKATYGFESHPRHLNHRRICQRGENSQPKWRASTY